jgi:hypothetical protein
MDRRNFLRNMLGVAAATALPSEVFPFRKIFLPAAPTVASTMIIEGPWIDPGRVDILDWQYWGRTFIPDEFIEELVPYLTGVCPVLTADGRNRTATAFVLHQEDAKRKVDHFLQRFIS